MPENTSTSLGRDRRAVEAVQGTFTQSRVRSTALFQPA